MTNSIKNIELSQLQRNQLLEMAKALFPEYYAIEMVEYDNVDNEWGIYFLTKKTFNLLKKGEPKDFEVENIFIEEWDVKIHWFQFCMTNLASKVCSFKRNYLKLSNWQEFRLINTTKTHPVDYLYKQFKLQNL